MLYAVLKKHKRDFLDEFEFCSQLIYKSYVKKSRSKKDLISKKRASVSDIQLSYPNHYIESVISYDVTHLYKMKLQFLSISFNFPKSFSSLDELKDNVNITIQILNSDDRNYKGKSLKFKDFNQIVEDYHYVASLMSQHNVFEYIQASQSYLVESLFTGAVMSDNASELSFVVSEIKNSEDDYTKALLSKNKYMEKRREKNRKIKDHKKKARSTLKSQISKNKDEIQKLRSRIGVLEYENAQFESNAKGDLIAGEEKSELQSLMNKYRDNYLTLKLTDIKKRRQMSDFGENIMSHLFQV